MTDEPIEHLPPCAGPVGHDCERNVGACEGVCVDCACCPPKRP